MDTLCVKRLTSTAILPTRAHPDDAGLDLYADESVVIPEYHRAVVKTGVAVAIDSGKVGLIWPRSGLAARGLSTDAGVIDSAYRGEIGVVLTNGTPHKRAIQAGDKIAQLLVQPVSTPVVQEVDSLNATERGSAGFGSTGA